MLVWKKNVTWVMLMSSLDVAIFGYVIEFVAEPHLKLITIEESYTVHMSIGLQKDSGKYISMGYDNIATVMIILNSEFIDLFNYHLAKMDNVGITNNIARKWLRNVFHKGKQF